MFIPFKDGGFPNKLIFNIFLRYSTQQNPVSCVIRVLGFISSSVYAREETPVFSLAVFG